MFIVFISQNDLNFILSKMCIKGTKVLKGKYYKYKRNIYIYFSETIVKISVKTFKSSLLRDNRDIF